MCAIHSGNYLISVVRAKCLWNEHDSQLGQVANYAFTLIIYCFSKHTWRTSFQLLKLAILQAKIENRWCKTDEVVAGQICQLYGMHYVTYTKDCQDKINEIFNRFADVHVEHSLDEDFSVWHSEVIDLSS